ncbi:hypothetical protein RJ498_002595 [Pluralibacter gergoviae]
MKPENFSLVNFFKIIRILFADIMQGLSTCIFAFASFGSLYILDGWMKLAGFVAFILLAYFITLLMDVLKN